jgi:hypothetical protein
LSVHLLLVCLLISAIRADLLKAHRVLDKAKRVAFLFALHQKYTADLLPLAAKEKKPGRSEWGQLGNETSRISKVDTRLNQGRHRGLPLRYEV